jgi:hypothetical protein
MLRISQIASARDSLECEDCSIDEMLLAVAFDAHVV